MSLWSVEEKDELKTLWLEGFSAAQIGAKLGKTRCACIGRARRDNLPQHIKANCGGPGRKCYTSKEKVRTVRQSKTNGEPVQHIPFWEPIPKIIDELIPIEQRKTLMELEDHDCRWPVGDVGEKGFFFCGSPTANQPYCLAHFHRSIEPQSKQRKSQRFTDFHMFSKATQKHSLVEDVV